MKELGGLRVLFFDDFEQFGFLALKIPGFSQITRSVTRLPSRKTLGLESTGMANDENLRHGFAP